jgi:sugar lactone lactonase YvrE
MKRLLKFWLLSAAALAGVVAGGQASDANPAGAAQYVIANDDVVFPFLTGVTFYKVGADGGLTLQKKILTGGFGVGGGFFGANRLSVLNSASQKCVYASEAMTGDVVGINVSTLAVGGSAKGSKNDAGTSNGIGLAMQGQYLYASFTDSNTIGTFQIQGGCGLSFLNHIAVVGVGGGIINGMAARGSILVVTYTDGTIESFDISGGTPVPNGDKQYSTATSESQDATYPNSVDITSDGHYAIFGDTSTHLVVEVSDITSGKLAKTVVHRAAGTISSSNIMLSPDETLLYVINTQGAKVSALHFDKRTGTLSGGCSSAPIRGLSENWSYLARPALINQTGNGGGVYVPEFGNPSGIAIVTFHSSGTNCWLKEEPNSPIANPNSPGLLTIGTFPPRSF